MAMVVKPSSKLVSKDLLPANLNRNFSGRADMYPKMTWGTPLPPQTPFTYPPYKKIGHMAVMGSTMSIESKPLLFPAETSPRYSKYDSDSIATSRSLNLEPAKQSRFMVRKITLCCIVCESYISELNNYAVLRSA